MFVTFLLSDFKVCLFPVGSLVKKVLQAVQTALQESLFFDIFRSGRSVKPMAYFDRGNTGGT